ncbi:MAG: META domain-containing protein, partial [Caldilineaceae bacterium]|nr:META domain-containing protein [Caldilineaceae bacterium]
MVSLDNLNGTSWVLTEMNGEAVESATAEITLVFKDGDIGGSSGCNTYRSSVAAKAGDAPQTIALTPPIVTRMMCPEPVMTLENNFLPRLGAVIQWGYMAGDLALLYQLDDEVGTLIFAPQPASE